MEAVVPPVIEQPSDRRDRLLAPARGGMSPAIGHFSQLGLGSWPEEFGGAAVRAPGYGRFAVSIDSTGIAGLRDTDRTY
jgi:hypothetical protein